MPSMSTYLKRADNRIYNLRRTLKRGQSPFSDNELTLSDTGEKSLKGSDPFTMGIFVHPFVHPALTEKHTSQ